ncbi:MAG TPA: carbohydrate kinase [Micrococcales bacterium]|uniref:carbohydrate kinase family protein n=1 Tax=Miniimonas TaxID=947525 RepID=UPI000D528D86|nr:MULTISPECIES: carbohydrate kinase [Miniimonas]HCX86051.1 carbohydrate kinase [Micrococcales bacterium]
MQALVIGEALVDIVQRPGAEPEVYPGGSPANVAIGLARLGRDVQLLTWLGEDKYGDQVRHHLESSRVRIASGSQRAERTSTAAATIADDGSATYDFDLTIDYPDHQVADDVVVVHLGSIGAVLQPGADKAAALIGSARHRAIITYDPNLRPSIMGSAAQVRECVLGLVAGADVVKVSDEDLAWFEPGKDPRDVARAWAASGPALVVVTLGAEGSFATTAHGVEAEVPAPSVTVADTVGAGDSFMGGLIDGLWSTGLVGADKHEAIAAVGPSVLLTLLGQAAAIAAITVSRPGANPPTRLELLNAPGRDDA